MLMRRCSMTTAARDLLSTFDDLSPADQKEVAAEILRRAMGDGDVSDASWTELAAELFRSYDAEEAAR
jgi:hypothetical protein